MHLNKCGEYKMTFQWNKDDMPLNIRILGIGKRNFHTLSILQNEQKLNCIFQPKLLAEQEEYIKRSFTAVKQE